MTTKLHQVIKRIQNMSQVNNNKEDIEDPYSLPKTNKESQARPKAGIKFLSFLMTLALLMIVATLTLFFIDKFDRSEVASQQQEEGGPSNTMNDKLGIFNTSFPTNYPTNIPSMFQSESNENNVDGEYNDDESITIIPVTGAPTSTPSIANSVIISPTQAPTRVTEPPQTPHVEESLTYFPQAVVLQARNGLKRGQFVSSPSGRYQVGLSVAKGDLVLRDTQSEEIFWHANVTGGVLCYMQSDGNLIIRDELNNPLWSTKTGKNPFSSFVIDDGGLAGVISRQYTYIWMQGLPRGKYTGPSEEDFLTFPIRAAFYFSWYPETWKVGGNPSKVEPDLGFYNSADSSVVQSHIHAMDYGHIDLGIVSWWGPSTKNDRSRITLLMNDTLAQKANVKWTIYYEELGMDNSKVAEHLDYLREWFAWHPTWAHIDGKPVIFVYNSHVNGCDTVERWVNQGRNNWHIVLKVFPNFQDCPVQPDSWHQYAPTKERSEIKGHSYSISPGYWKANEELPRLPRLNETEWCEAVQDMVQSQEPWHLITTFNQAGDGTMIEPSTNWTSPSGYGYYLDCLAKFY
jgi:hypothetical protein